MLKREIKYEDFNGDQTSDVCYFNLSKTELIELEVRYDQGFSNLLKRIVETKDDKEIVKIFKDIILMSYGQKSDDGKRFIKNDQLREEFEQTAAYDQLFMELASDDEKAAIFLKGILPRDLAAEVEKEEKAAAPPADQAAS